MFDSLAAVALPAVVVAVVAFVFVVVDDVEVVNGGSGGCVIDILDEGMGPANGDLACDSAHSYTTRNRRE